MKPFENVDDDFGGQKGFVASNCNVLAKGKHGFRSRTHCLLRQEPLLFGNRSQGMKFMEETNGTTTRIHTLIANRA